MSALPKVLLDAQQQIQSDLTHCLDFFDFPVSLKDAIHHAVMLGGKRVRPALCYATALLKDAQVSPAARRAAVAVELIHCYSLVHDDLPCMDNDALRRGQPTVHVVYGEANALLSGDVLQSMAYEVLGSRLFETQHVPEPQIALHQMQLLATASSKMVCGQVLDLQAEGQQVTQQALEHIHRNKTGALIQAAIMMGATTVLERNHVSYPSLRQFGQALGLAFQVQDDILDIISETEVLGKTAGKDIQVEKSTYPALMGLAEAQNYAEKLHHEAIQALAKIEGNTQPLVDIAEFLLNRHN